MRYFLIDRILEMEPGKSARAIKNISASEDVLADHFPGFPLYPGALLLESMAQLGGLLIEKTITEKHHRRVLPVLSIVKKAKFRDAVLPGDSLVVTAELEHVTEDAAGIHAEMEREGKTVAEADLLYTLIDVKEIFGENAVSPADHINDILAKISAFRKGRAV
jgi:3-hydroxyacyl-[acyl-carrier-protein] dehydratase